MAYKTWNYTSDSQLHHIGQIITVKSHQSHQSHNITDSH